MFFVVIIAKNQLREKGPRKKYDLYNIDDIAKEAKASGRLYIVMIYPRRLQEDLE